MTFPSAMGGPDVGMSARQPSRLRAALTARLSLLFRDGNVKKSAGRHRLRRPPTNARAPLNQFPSAAQPSHQTPTNPPASVTQNSASSTPPTVTINGDNPAIVQVGDSYADHGATVSDTGPRQAGDTNLGYQPSSTALRSQASRSTQAKSPPTPSTTSPPTLTASPQLPPEPSSSKVPQSSRQTTPQQPPRQQQQQRRNSRRFQIYGKTASRGRQQWPSYTT